MNAGVLIGLAVLAYYFYSQMSTSSGPPSGAPSDSVPLPLSISASCASGQYTWYSPSTKAVVGCAGATAAQLAAGAAYVASLATSVSTTTTPTTVVTTTPTSQPTTPVAVTPAIANGQLTAAVAQGFKAGDPAIASSGGVYSATPYVLAYYLQNVAVPSMKGTNLNLAAAFPGVDLTQPMTVATFISGMQPLMASGVTLSGLGRMRVPVGRGGWAV
jgi:hypothetical protein